MSLASLSVTRGRRFAKTSISTFNCFATHLATKRQVNQESKLPSSPSMSSNLKYKQVAQVSRRTWDTEVYEKKAKERSKQAEEASSGKHNSNKSSSHNNGPNLPASSSTGGADYESKEEFVPAAAGAAGPMKSKRAFLKARKSKVDVDSKIGTTEFVNPEAAAAASSSSEGGATSIKVRRNKVILFITLRFLFERFSPFKLTFLFEIFNFPHNRTASQKQASGGIAKYAIAS